MRVYANTNLAVISMLLWISLITVGTSFQISNPAKNLKHAFFSKNKRTISTQISEISWPFNQCGVYNFISIDSLTLSNEPTYWMETVFTFKGTAINFEDVTLDYAKITVFWNLVELGSFDDDIKQTYKKGDPISYSTPYIDFKPQGFAGLWTFNIEFFEKFGFKIHCLTFSVQPKPT